MLQETHFYQENFLEWNVRENLRYLTSLLFSEQFIPKYFLDKKTDGNPVVLEEDTRIVYVYKKNSDTTPWIKQRNLIKI